MNTNATAQMVYHDKVAPRHQTKKLSTEQIIEIVKREIDNCTHPECDYDRECYGYSKCAGGHIARRVVKAIEEAERDGYPLPDGMTNRGRLGRQGTKKRLSQKSL